MTATATSPPSSIPTLDSLMAQAREENFPVALALLGRTRRAQLGSLYGFARLVDDIGDEAEGDRVALLDWLQCDLDRVFAGGTPAHAALRRLAPTVRACALSQDPFRKLIEANRRDQLIDRYRTFEDLLDYCRLSAAPVGELVLGVFGCATPERVALSDQVCAALQITEHLQDVTEDLDRGRVYVPAEDLERFGCTELELGATRPSAAFAALMAFQVARARSLLDEGAPLIASLPPTAALAVAGFVAGGRTALAAIEDAGYDVLGCRPRPSRRALASAMFATLWRRR